MKPLKQIRNITGKIIYNELATGFWGIVDKQADNWRIANMPAELQRPNLKIKATIRRTDINADGSPNEEQGFSIFMWGKPAEIVTFEILK